MLKTLGVSAACMSTIPEVIAAARLRLRVAGVSCITNMGTGISGKPLAHQEVTEIAGQMESTFRALLNSFVLDLAENDPAFL